MSAETVSVNQAIISAVTTVLSVCVPDFYEGGESEYSTFNYDEIPELFGDDTAEAVRYLIQIHYFLPYGINCLSKRKRLKNALADAGFTFPKVYNASDEKGQHYVFECEWAEGVSAED